LGVRKPDSDDMVYNEQGEAGGLVNMKNSDDYQGMSVNAGQFPTVPMLLPTGYGGSKRKPTLPTVILFKIQKWIIDTTPGIKFYPDGKGKGHGVVGPSHDCEDYQDEYKPAIESAQRNWLPEYMDEPNYGPVPPVPNA
jgi:hypothetical protein